MAWAMREISETSIERDEGRFSFRRSLTRVGWLRCGVATRVGEISRRRWQRWIGREIGSVSGWPDIITVQSSIQSVRRWDWIHQLGLCVMGWQEIDGKGCFPGCVSLRNGWREMRKKRERERERERRGRGRGGRRREGEKGNARMTNSLLVDRISFFSLLVCRLLLVLLPIDRFPDDHQPTKRTRSIDRKTKAHVSSFQSTESNEQLEIKDK